MINLEFYNIDNAVRQIEEYANSLMEKLHRLLELLMNEGWEIAAVGFSEAVYDGDRDVMLNLPYWEGDTIYLVANGKSVAFIEFGSGTTYEEYPPDKKPSEVLPHGEFGKKKGKEPPWVYVGNAGDNGTVLAYKKDGRAVVRTEGNPPARAMYNASKVLDKEHIQKMAREVFK